MTEAWFQITDDEKLAREVVELVEPMWEREGRERLAIAQDCLCLYTGSTRYSLTGRVNPFAILDDYRMSNSGTSYNLIQAICDTRQAQLFQNKVRPLVMTEGGDSEFRDRASAMQQAIEGLLYEHDVYGELGLARCQDGQLFEAGGIEWTADITNSRVLAHRAACWEYFVPPREARFGRSTQLFARHVVPRSALLALFAEAPQKVIDEITDAPEATREDVYEDLQSSNRVVDQVVVYKAWHLPSGRVDLDDPKTWGRTQAGRSVDAPHDGRHVVAIKTRSGWLRLPFPVEWPWDHFPVSWFKPQPVPGSYWSRGVPEIIAGAQLTLNRWNQRIERILDLHARPLIFLWRAAKINPYRLTNAPGNIFETAVPPAQAFQQYAPPSVPQELLQRESQIQEKIRDQLGMSELSMTARKPAGIEHAPPMRFLEDTESARHTTERNAWERAHLDDAKNIVRCLRTLAEHDPKFETVFGAADQLKRFRWKEIALDNDEFRIKAWATNLFASTPAARAEQALDMLDRGLLTPMQAVGVIDATDLRALVGDESAFEANIRKRLDRVQKEGLTVELMPHPFLDLAQAKRLAAERINRLEADGEPRERVERLIKFAEAVDRAIQMAQTEQPSATSNPNQGAPMQPVASLPGGSPSGPTTNGAPS